MLQAYLLPMIKEGPFRAAMAPPKASGAWLAALPPTLPDFHLLTQDSCSSPSHLVDIQATRMKEGQREMHVILLRRLLESA